MAWASLAVLLVGADLIGNASTYVYAIILIASLPLLLGDARLRQSLRRPAALAYLASYLSLAIAFVCSAQSPWDLQYAGNFILFLAFSPAVALFSVNAGHRASETFGWFALAGAVGALLSALHDVYIIGFERAVGFINLTNPFAMASVMLGFLSMVGFFARRDHWRLVFLLGPLCACANSMLTGTRGAVVMIAALILVFLVFWGVTLDRRQKLIVVTIGALLFAIIAAFSAVAGTHMRALSAFDALAVFVGKGQAIDFSTEIRLNLYYGGFRAFLESPIFGHGWWHHVEAARPFMSPEVQAYTVRWSHLHNDYVNFAALAGVLGLAAFAIYLIAPVWSAAVSRKDSQYIPRLYGAIVLTTCYAVFGMFDTSFSMEMLTAFGPVCAAALLGYCVDKPFDEIKEVSGILELKRG